MSGTMQIDQILCPLDYSEYSRHALDQALALTRWYGGTITALHVIPPGVAVQGIGPAVDQPNVPSPTDLDLYRAQAQRFVDAEAAGDAARVVTVEVTIGDPIHDIVCRATALPADLIVMGTHGRRGFDRLLLGSVAERVLRQAPCPVLIVPPRAPDAVPAGPEPYRRVLCAVDFSQVSERLIALAMSLTGSGATRVTVVHVMELAQIFEPTMISVPDTFNYRTSLRADRLERLRRFVAAHAPDARDVESVLAEGKPHREILRIAAEAACDVILLGVHGGTSGAVAFGSTVNQVARQAQCPVLTVRP